jgi:hypothetical protein
LRDRNCFLAGAKSSQAADQPPHRNYLFMLNVVDDAYGGLEHVTHGSDLHAQGPAAAPAIRTTPPASTRPTPSPLKQRRQPAARPAQPYHLNEVFAFPLSLLQDLWAQGKRT